MLTQPVLPSISITLCIAVNYLQPVKPAGNAHLVGGTLLRLLFQSLKLLCLAELLLALLAFACACQGSSYVRCS